MTFNISKQFSIAATRWQPTSMNIQHLPRSTYCSKAVVMQLASTILLIQAPCLSAFRGAAPPFRNYELFGETEPHALVKQVRLSGAEGK